MKQIRYVCGLTFLLLPFLLLAQEKKEKGVIKIDLAYHQQNDDLPVLKVSAKTKNGRKFESVEGIEINVFFNEETPRGFIGRVKTNYFGVGSLMLPERLKSSWDSLISFTFLATVTSNERFEDQSTEIEISKARIELSMEEEDSVRTIHAKVLALQDSGWTALPETEIKFVVRRLMSDLSAAADESYVTDENGAASAEFNLTIPGDVNGDIIIGAKIDDHELYGNLVSSKGVKWGVTLVPDNSFAERTLWATRNKTPLWLLIFPNIIIVGVWGIIFYLVFQINRIIKLGKTKEST
jgi:hypothetical protein